MPYLFGGDAMQFDAIIVGGGVIGLSVARELVRAKHKVCIAEKDKLGAVPHQRAGHLRPKP
jgi:glycine/D-amino acid oxidase-like deaminating enzyme